MANFISIIRSTLTLSSSLVSIMYAIYLAHINGNGFIPKEQEIRGKIKYCKIEDWPQNKQQNKLAGKNHIATERTLIEKNEKNLV